MNLFIRMIASMLSIVLSGPKFPLTAPEWFATSRKKAHSWSRVGCGASLCSHFTIGIEGRSCGLEGDVGAVGVDQLPLNWTCPSIGMRGGKLPPVAWARRLSGRRAPEAAGSLDDGRGSLAATRVKELGRRGEDRA
jgi:hypothetical protein